MAWKRESGLLIWSGYRFVKLFPYQGKSASKGTESRERISHSDSTSFSATRGEEKLEGDSILCSSTLTLPSPSSLQRLVFTLTKNQKFLAGDMEEKEHKGIKEGSYIN